MPYRSDTLATMAKTDTYPHPGTRAALVYDHIAQNPGVTKNGIISGLSFNPSVVKKCVENLLNKGRIADRKDDQGHHHYTVRTRI